ncbi:zinc-ribbon domain-containing protein [Lentilactobacillus kosonis]|uniref:Zinc-ribbon domain-containing protein n=1 Tax=Lentilactobacillus kosonis TaxID=2810561 RepID=A0A401FIA5_9LACO|nr:zinc ribbon domain-containing protein [Lentilactobacillus kosonis]GAY72028.1 hypothetical protein NBRC111893_174 [Lentilactobacillus kosonis]
MSVEDKVCVKCGRTIPGYSRFCPYCGAAQPAISTNNKVSNNKRSAQRTSQGMSPMHKLGLIIGVLAVILAIAKFTTFKDGPSHHKIEEELHLDMFEGQTAYGKHPKVTVNKHKGTIIKISYKSTALKNIQSNPDWRRLTKKSIKKVKRI